MRNLDLALIGNCTLGALIDERAEMVWACFPRFDGDPVFCSLLDGEGQSRTTPGSSRVELVDFRAHRAGTTLENTAILVTRLFDRHGGCDRSHRLRATLRPARPHVPAHDPGAAAAPPDRQSAPDTALAPGLHDYGAARPTGRPGAATTSVTSAGRWCCG
jgi:hypothetical protein